MSTLDVEDHVPDQLVDQLAKGYDSLYGEIRRLDERSQQLENKLAWAKQQVIIAPSIHSLVHDDTQCSRSVA
jgi:cell division septum initiation protein DivIVA